MCRRLSKVGHAPLRKGQRACPHCGTVLSRYNPTGTCWQVERWQTPEERALEALDDPPFHAALHDAAFDVATGAPV